MTTDKSKTVLVAEDDYLVSEEIVRGLKALGYKNIIEVSDGIAAVEETCTLRPDIVLMDIKMPKLDGLEATRQIQDRCPAPVVILTAYESEELLKKAGEAGIAAYLTKPLKQGELERAIVIALARHRDLMELRRLNRALRLALAEVKELRGILPICASCKKIRDDKGYWQQIETYISDHSEAEFSHGICPACAEKLYPELYNK
jgi:two-component system, response regulator PdtaR